MLSEYNLRQLNLMQEKIKQYREKGIRIDQLINDLEALLNCLEDIDEGWKNSFLNSWSVLEIEYASALYNDKGSFDDRAIAAIDKSLEELGILINDLTKKLWTNLNS